MEATVSSSVRPFFPNGYNVKRIHNGYNVKKNSDNLFNGLREQFTEMDAVSVARYIYYNFCYYF